MWRRLVSVIALAVTAACATSAPLTLRDTDRQYALTHADGHRFTLERTVLVRPKESFRLVLSGLDWASPTTSDPDVIRVEAVDRRRPKSCRPEQTCGETVVTGLAVSVGEAFVTTSHSHCGEAFRCTPQDRTTLITHFRVARQ